MTMVMDANLMATIERVAVAALANYIATGEAPIELGGLPPHNELEEMLTVDLLQKHSVAIAEASVEFLTQIVTDASDRTAKSRNKLKGMVTQMTDEELAQGSGDSAADMALIADKIERRRALVASIAEMANGLLGLALAAGISEALSLGGASVAGVLVDAAVGEVLSASEALMADENAAPEGSATVEETSPPEAVAESAPDEVLGTDEESSQSSGNEG